jgi:hypothetical protein
MGVFVLFVCSDCQTFSSSISLGVYKDHPIAELSDVFLLLRSHMPMVTYLRLDGSTPAGSRHALVQRYTIYYSQIKASKSH